MSISFLRKNALSIGVATRSDYRESASGIARQDFGSKILRLDVA